MKILHVVTYISPDGAYGGPVRVAINQAKVLTELGHDVVVAAAAGGFEGSLPAEFDGFPVRLFAARRLVPKSGFAGLTSPGLLRWLAHAVRGADVVHVHMARDMVTLPAAAVALLKGKPLVLQTHGMIAATEHPLAQPLDWIITNPILHRSSTVFYLTEVERGDLVAQSSKALTLQHLVNGVVAGNYIADEQVTGANPRPEVLFLARLHGRKRPLFMVESAAQLTNHWPSARWHIVGPDEGEATKVETAILKRNLTQVMKWEGAMDPSCTLMRMQEASIYVLPAVQEPFGMTALEAMAIGLPVVVTESCGLAPVVRENHAGIVCGDSQQEVTEAIDTLLRNPNLRIAMGANARKAVENQYSMQAIGKQLLKVYGDATRHEVSS